MKNLLALAAFLVLLFVAVGYFRGWYLIRSSPTHDGGNRVIIDFNSRKIRQDLDNGKEKLSNFLDSKKNNKATADNSNSSIQQTNHTVVNKPQPPQSPQPEQTLPLQHSSGGGFVLPGQTPITNQPQPIPMDSWIFPQPQSQPQPATNQSSNNGIWFASPSSQ